MRKALIPAAIVALAWAGFASFTGGLDTRIFGIVIRARGAFRPLAIGLALLLAHVLLHREEFMRGGDRVAALLSRGAAPIAVATALFLGVYAVRFGSFTAGGSDSYGYVSEAYGWARGELPRPIPLPLTLPFPSSDLIQTPLGYHVGQQRHTMVPTYAPGLPLLMAVGLLIAGACGPFFVTPICAALFVWFTFLLARRAAGPIAGAIAVLVVAVSPVVLFQALWPMSDVPAGAFWTGALVASLAGSRKAAVTAGLCTAIGVLIRPNVLPLVLVPMIGVAMSEVGRERWIRIALFLLPVAPVPLFVATLNALWFGSPLNSGYGSARELYALANVWPNVRLYAAWFWESESPWSLVGILALLPVGWKHANARAIGMSVLMLSVTLGCYLTYSPFEVWWYLRFLLPAGGATATLIAIGIVTLAREAPSPWGRIAAGVVLWMLVSTTVWFTRSTGLFGGVRTSEARYIDVGEFVTHALPANAAILSGQHSGSLRFYGGRMTLRFDFVDRDWVARAPVEIERAGLHPYLLLEDFELPQFRSQFGLPAGSDMPWPVIARMREVGGLTVWDLGSVPPRTQPVALEPGSRHWCPGPALPLKAR